MEARAMALHKRGGIYHYHFWVDGTRYRGSTKKANLAAARRVESLLLAQAEEKGDVVLRKRSPLLRDFKIRFFEWVEGNTTLKQKTRDYYENGWRLLEETDVAAMRINAITKDDADRLTFPGVRQITTTPCVPYGGCSEKLRNGLLSKLLQRSNSCRSTHGSASSTNALKPSFCLSANSRFAMC